MAVSWRLAAVFLGLSLPINEGFGSTMYMGVREKSRAEIMAGMTTQSALKMVMRRARKDPALASLIQATSGQLVGVANRHNTTEQMQVSFRGSQGKSFDEAIEKLNSMTREAQLALDTETQRCLLEEQTMTEEMEWLQDQVRRHNAEAASARAAVLIAQGNIKTFEELLRDTSLRFEEHKRVCIEELQELNDELKIVLGDVTVMEKIIELIDCDSSSKLVQESQFVQCAHCNNGIMLQHAAIQQAMSKLKSQVAKDFAKGSAVRLGVFTQGGFKYSPDLPLGGVNVSDVPTAPVPFDCQPTTKCTIAGNPNCQKLLDKFLVCQAGVLDRKAELEQLIFNKQQYCEQQSRAFTEQITGINTRLRKERGDLAIGTKRQNENEEGSHQKSSQHAEVATQYTTEMKTCCDNKNDARSELCALEKIRGEVAKIEGKNLYFIDCAVSDWSDEECSATCGGGTMRRTRSIITQPQGGGVQCPPLEALVVCNDHDCPVDCRLYDWEGWSACSAECGGGVRERTRSVQVEANHGGEPCEDTEEEEACNIQGCDADCVLSEWSDWSSCSKMCGGGTQRRTKYVQTPAVGNGECWEPEDWRRLHFHDCNDFMCSEFLPEGRETLVCESKVDVVILLDSSASLGSLGWEKSYKLAAKLIEGFGGGTNDGDVKVALELFSGPKTYTAYKKCTQIAVSDSANLPNMKDDCGIDWVQHFTSTKAEINTLATAVAAYSEDEWMQSTTLTSVALGQADDELYYGREDANSVVIVITDGWPMSQRNTKAAAKRLQEHAKVVWAAVGSGAPLKLIEKMASKPERDHVITIDSFEDLERPWAINQLISTTCPKIG